MSPSCLRSDTIDVARSLALFSIRFANSLATSTAYLRLCCLLSLNHISTDLLTKPAEIKKSKSAGTVVAKRTELTSFIEKLDPGRPFFFSIHSFTMILPMRSTKMDMRSRFTVMRIKIAKFEGIIFNPLDVPSRNWRVRERESTSPTTIAVVMVFFSFFSSLSFMAFYPGGTVGAYEGYQVEGKGEVGISSFGFYLEGCFWKSYGDGSQALVEEVHLFESGFVMVFYYVISADGIVRDF